MTQVSRGTSIFVLNVVQELQRKLKDRRRLLTLLILAWAANYFRGVRRIRLHLGEGNVSSRSHKSVQNRMVRIMNGCPSLHAIYWPAWFAPDAWMQFLLVGLKELRARVLQPCPYSRQVLTLRDRAQIALDWVLPDLANTKGGEKLPVCVLLHGAFQDSRSVTMTDLARDLAVGGMPVVVMNRRGYGGMGISVESPGLALFGLDEDLDEVLAAVEIREPNRPVAVIGFSCGSGFAGRYVGKRALASAWDSEQVGGRTPRILCAVCIDPGYDVSPEGAITRIKPPLSWVMNWGLKYFYVFRHRSELRQKSMSFANLVSDMLSPKNGASNTMRLTRRLSGVGGSQEWLKIQQPCLLDIKMPCLAINSRDDPVCVWANVEAHFKDIKANPNLVLAEFARGSHGCKFGLWGGANVTHAMIRQFVISCCEVWQADN